MIDTAKHVIDRLLYLIMPNNKKFNCTIKKLAPGLCLLLVFCHCIRHLKSLKRYRFLHLLRFGGIYWGSILLSEGRRERRFIPATCQVMHPSAYVVVPGDRHPILRSRPTRLSKKPREWSAKILADNCGQDFEKVMKDFD